MRWYCSLQTTYMTEYRDSPVSDSATDALLLSLAHYWRIWHADMLLFIKHSHCHYHRASGFAMLICYCLLNTVIVIIIELRDFSCSLICYTLVSVLVLGIGIASGQYYWVLDIGCFSWYRSNLTKHQ